MTNMKAVFAALIALFCIPFSASAGETPTHDIRPGMGVTVVKQLSDYLPALAGTAGETKIYCLEGKEPGASVFVAGGTHAGEIAGIVAATILVEKAQVLRGRLIVIPHANNSAVGFGDRRPSPPSIFIETQSGKREFLYGFRLTHPACQGEPDPVKYHLPNSSEEINGSESRNLNRAYPGKANGNLTQKIAFAIVELLKRESVDIAFDLHESGATSKLAWMIIANPKNVGIGALAVLALDEAGIPMKLESSTEAFRGLSHREWGDRTQAMAFLFETPNPLMNYANPGEGIPGADPVNDALLPLSRRVGVQLSAFQAVLDAYNEAAAPEAKAVLSGAPGLPEIMAAGGLGAFLNRTPAP
jgi:hypothetical protein